MGRPPTAGGGGVLPRPGGLPTRTGPRSTSTTATACSGSQLTLRPLAACATGRVDADRRGGARSRRPATSTPGSSATAQPQTEFVNHDTEEMTLSVPGTARSVITVGAVDAARTRSGSAPSPRSGRRATASGPARHLRARRADHRGRAAAAAVDDVVAMARHEHGRPACHGGRRAGAFARRSSTAGPADRPQTQVRALLQQNTMFDNAFWDRGQGFGVLDVRKLLEQGLPTLM